MADLDQDLALAQLEALVTVRGALKVVTAEVHPDLRTDPTDPRSPLDPAHDPALLKQVATMVLHDVVALVGPNEKGQYEARTAEGDWCLGRPAALLKRLQEWRG